MTGELPISVLQQLRADGGYPETVQLAARGDLDSDGRFGEQWLLIDPSHVRVIERHDGRATLRHSYARPDIEGARVERCIGNGLLQVTIAGRPRVLLHYTNELAARFGRVAQYLQSCAVSPGKTVPLPDEAMDGHACLECGRLLPDNSSKVCPTCIERGKLLRRLSELARPYWKGIGVITLLLLAGVGLDLLPPFLIRILVDNVLKVNGSHLLLLQLVAGMVGIQVVRLGVTVLTNWKTANISTRFSSDVRERLFMHVSRLPIPYFDRNQTGRLLTRINQDTDELQGLVSQITGFSLNTMLVLGIGAALFSMSPSLGLYVLIPTPFVVAAALFYYRHMRPHFSRMWVARWRLNAMLTTFLSGVRVVKAFAQERREESRYRERNTQMLQSRLQVDLAWSKFFPLVSFVFGAGGLIIWYAGGRAVLDERITLGTLMAFLSYLGMFYGPLSNLTQVSQALNRFLTISQRTFEMLDEEPQVEIARPVRRPVLDGRIEFDHVSFGYDPYNPVVRDLTFTIEPGEMVGVVGHSGAGKTTLISLLCRFYDVTEGTIRVDGVDLRELSMEEIRQQIGIVLQTPFLFRGTIAENIAYGRPEAGRLEIIRAAKAANAHDFITMLPEGYDTIVGEGGTGLSGGEMQRVSIARAILHNPRILILDEATSSVDTMTERQIQEAMDRLVKGRTTIAIAHRLSTLYGADRIMVLNHGRLEEEGPPHDLLEARGAFYDLVQMQARLAGLDPELVAS